MNEVWKDIKGYEGYYQVSSLGRIKSLDRYVFDKNGNTRFKQGKMIVLGEDNDGYLHIRLYKNGTGKTYTVHKIVATHFIEMPIDFKDVNYEINHKDNDRKNNCYTNLEWITHTDNIRYSIKSGNAHCLNVFGANNNNSHEVKLYTDKMLFVERFDTIIDCAQYLINNKISSAKSASQLSCNISRIVDRDKKYLKHYFKSA